MNTAMTMNRKSNINSRPAKRFLRRAAALMLVCGWATTTLAGGPSKVQDIVLGDALMTANTHYCSVVNYSTATIKFSIAFWDQYGSLVFGNTINVLPGKRTQLNHGDLVPTYYYCTVSYTGQVGDARAAHCASTTVPNSLDIMSQACLPLN